MKIECAKQSKNKIACVFRLFVFVAVMSFYAYPALSKICFLPAGRCDGDVEYKPLADTCTGYNLAERICSGNQSVCGWDCKSCTNKSSKGTWWRCTALTCSTRFNLDTNLAEDGQCGWSCSTCYSGNVAKYECKGVGHSGYNISQKERNRTYTDDFGWNCSSKCDSNTNWYKCSAVDCAAGYAKGKTCDTSKGWKLVQNGKYSGGQKCGKCEAENQCSEGFAPNVFCDAAAGWKITYDGKYSGGVACGKCEADNQCSAGYVAGQVCDASKGWNLITEDKYSGGKQCGKCEIINDCSAGFAPGQTCDAAKGWRLVTEDKYSGGIQCGKCVEDNQCSYGYTPGRVCDTASGWKVRYDGKYSGGVACGKCVEDNQCSSGYTKGKTCDSSKGEILVQDGHFSAGVPCGRCVSGTPQCTCATAPSGCYYINGKTTDSCGTANACVNYVSGCPSGQTCKNGTCKPVTDCTCDSAPSGCYYTDGKTTDSCGTANACTKYVSGCPEGKTCENGSCTDAPVTRACSCSAAPSGCYYTDGKTADSCGTANACTKYVSGCPKGQTCKNNKCIGCETPVARDASKCITKAAKTNCGEDTYENACSAGQTCYNGTCQNCTAPAGYSDSADGIKCPTSTTVCGKTYYKADPDLYWHSGYAQGLGAQCCPHGMVPKTNNGTIIPNGGCWYDTCAEQGLCWYGCPNYDSSLPGCNYTGWSRADGGACYSAECCGGQSCG